MPYYYIGTIIVIPTFAGIFTYPPYVNDKENGKIKNELFQAIWYLTLPALFNVGWAAVQISNMAIVNQLTYSNKQRDILCNNRNGFTYGANITVLGFALILVSYIQDAKHQFRYLSFISLFLGFFTSCFYITTIQEVKLSEEAKYYEQQYKELVRQEEKKEEEDNYDGS